MPDLASNRWCNRVDSQIAIRVAVALALSAVVTQTATAVELPRQNDRVVYVMDLEGTARRRGIAEALQYIKAGRLIKRVYYGGLDASKEDCVRAHIKARVLRGLGLETVVSAVAWCGVGSDGSRDVAFDEEMEVAIKRRLGSNYEKEADREVERRFRQRRATTKTAYSIEEMTSCQFDQ